MAAANAHATARNNQLRSEYNARVSAIGISESDLESLIGTYNKIISPRVIRIGGVSRQLTERSDPKELINTVNKLKMSLRSRLSPQSSAAIVGITRDPMKDIFRGVSYVGGR